MAYEVRDNSGTLFKNNKKTKDTQPNAKGEAKIGGVEYWVDAWTRQDKNGNPWQSLSFKRKDAQPAQQPAKPAAPQSLGKRDGGVVNEMQDDVPW